MRCVDVLLVLAIIVVVVMVICDDWNRERFTTGEDNRKNTDEHKNEIAKKIKDFMETDPNNVQLKDYLTMIGKTNNRSAEILEPASFNALKYLAKNKMLTSDNIIRLMTDV